MKRRVKISKKEIEALQNDDPKPGRGNRIEAIKLVRARADLMLRDAANLVDAFRFKGQKSITVNYKTAREGYSISYKTTREGYSISNAP